MCTYTHTHAHTHTHIRHDVSKCSTLLLLLFIVLNDCTCHLLHHSISFLWPIASFLTWLQNGRHSRWWVDQLQCKETNKQTNKQKHWHCWYASIFMPTALKDTAKVFWMQRTVNHIQNLGCHALYVHCVFLTTARKRYQWFWGTTQGRPIKTGTMDELPLHLGFWSICQLSCT